MFRGLQGSGGFSCLGIGGTFAIGRCRLAASLHLRTSSPGFIGFGRGVVFGGTFSVLCLIGSIGQSLRVGFVLQIVSLIQGILGAALCRLAGGVRHGAAGIDSVLREEIIPHGAEKALLQCEHQQCSAGRQHAEGPQIGLTSLLRGTAHSAHDMLMEGGRRLFLHMPHFKGDDLQSVKTVAAGGAGFQVLQKIGDLGSGQVTVQIPVHLLDVFFTARHGFPPFSPLDFFFPKKFPVSVSLIRSFSLAREMRDFTVPSSRSRLFAISS